MQRRESPKHILSVFLEEEVRRQLSIHIFYRKCNCPPRENMTPFRVEKVCTPFF